MNACRSAPRNEVRIEAGAMSAAVLNSSSLRKGDQGEKDQDKRSDWQA